jgi:mRNA-degrading endonuclease RelE of RelBE toxin-antitoxin system
MAYEIRHWPASVQREIDGLGKGAVAFVLVMLRTMREKGPRPEVYGVKPLPGHLHGLNQVNFKIRREQFRILFSVYENRIVIFHAFKKTSRQSEKRAYEKTLKRKRDFELLPGGSSDNRTIH